MQSAWHGSAGQDWLEIDLLKEYAVVKVIFYNRKDCCHSRADNALLTLMDSSRNVANTAVLNSNVMQVFTFAEVDTCSVTPTDWRHPRVPHSAAFVSDSVMAVLSQPVQVPGVDCLAQLHFLHIKSPTTSLWSGCVNVSLTQEGALLFDREQRLFSLLIGGNMTRFDTKGLIIDSQSQGIGHFVSSNFADTLESDLAAIVARAGFYSHCNLFTGHCENLVSQSECSAPVLAAAYGLHAVLKCNNSDFVYSSGIAGCEANSRLTARLSGCVQQNSHFVSTMVLNEASSAEARWLWAVSFRLHKQFAALFEMKGQNSPHPQQSTICAQIFGVLTYIHEARASSQLLQSSTRKHLDFLAIRNSIFDTLPCIDAKGSVNSTAVTESVEYLQRLHPWPHVTVSF